MKTIYIFIIFTAFSHANRSIEYPSTHHLCDNKSDFCRCLPIWVICNCQSGNKTIGSLFHNKSFILIKNCQQLTVPRGSFKYGQHLKVIFQNIKHLRLAAGSFETVNNGRINITISNSNLSEIPAGTFSAQDPVQPSRVATTTAKPNLLLYIADSEIGRMAPGMFANFTLQEMTITNTTIGHIDTRAIDNHVQRTASFINNTFVSLARRAVVLHSYRNNTKLVLGGNKFKGHVPQFLEGNITGDVCICNNSFPKLQTSPWRLRVGRDITLLGNTFPFLPRYGIDITVRYRISLTENDIYHLGRQAFLHIVPEGKKTIIIMDGNLIHQHEPMSLCLNEGFSSNSVIIRHIRFQQKCNCNITKTLSRALNITNPTIETTYSNDIHKQWFKNGECLLKPQGISHISIDLFIVRTCYQHNHLMEILLALALILILITVCVIVGWRRMRHTASNISSSAAGYHSYTEPYPSNAVPGSWLVVQPEARTYKETEIHVLFDKAEEIHGDEINKDEASNGNIKNIRRTPSPLARQSCPVLPLATDKS